MKKIKVLLIILFCATSINHGQFSKFKINPYSNSLLFSLGGGITHNNTDYSNSELGLFGSGKVEYYFNSSSEFFWGFQLSSNYSELIGNSDLIEFNQDVISVGPSIKAGYLFNKSFSPYVGLGIQNLWFEDLNSINMSAEFGLRYLISKYFAIYGELNLNFPSSDELDKLDVKGSKNDFFMNISLGISYAVDLTVTNDIDGDGIYNENDNCPEQAEDFDGFEDNDGCPEFDNDNDGIVDVSDNCPEEPEDYDGFEDNDGCPDSDNDNDGILDINDTCPDLKEDFDGFADSDGCPELDNDNDGILDQNDKCPNEPETFNSFEDADGCPDTLSKQVQLEDVKPKEEQKKVVSEPVKKVRLAVPNEFQIPGDELFEDNSAIIKTSAKEELNEIAEQLKINRDFKWRIEGHTDTSGSKRQLKVLSTSQANAVLNFFISKGLLPSMFTAVRMADQSPVAPNSTIQGKILNRRIKIKRIR
jgi:outer membrane protein OmpA-like peptidoglycan-associated protein